MELSSHERAALLRSAVADEAGWLRELAVAICAMTADAGPHDERLERCYQLGREHAQTLGAGGPAELADAAAGEAFRWGANAVALHWTLKAVVAELERGWPERWPSELVTQTVLEDSDPRAHADRRSCTQALAGACERLAVVLDGLAERIAQANELGPEVITQDDIEAWLSA